MAWHLIRDKILCTPPDALAQPQLHVVRHSAKCYTPNSLSTSKQPRLISSHPIRRPCDHHPSASAPTTFTTYTAASHPKTASPIDRHSPPVSDRSSLVQEKRNKASFSRGKRSGQSSRRKTRALTSKRTEGPTEVHMLIHADIYTPTYGKATDYLGGEPDPSYRAGDKLRTARKKGEAKVRNLRLELGRHLERQGKELKILRKATRRVGEL